MNGLHLYAAVFLHFAITTDNIVLSVVALTGFTLIGTLAEMMKK